MWSGMFCNFWSSLYISTWSTDKWKDHKQKQIKPIRPAHFLNGSERLDQVAQLKTSVSWNRSKCATSRSW